MKIEFPSDITSNGLSFGVLAQKVQSDLQAAGIKVDLAGCRSRPRSTRTARAPKSWPWYWGPDYPDPNDYLVFLPGQTVGLRAAGRAARTRRSRSSASRPARRPDPKVRSALYQTIGNDLNAKSPFYPLVQPGQVVASSSNLTKTAFNVVYWIDVTAVGSK